MPVRRTTVNGKPAYQWGTIGNKYPYTAGNKSSRERAKEKAGAQGVAAARRMGGRPHL